MNESVSSILDNMNEVDYAETIIMLKLLNLGCQLYLPYGEVRPRTWIIKRNVKGKSEYLEIELVVRPRFHGKAHVRRGHSIGALTLKSYTTRENYYYLFFIEEAFRPEEEREIHGGTYWVIPSKVLETLECFIYNPPKRQVTRDGIVKRMGGNWKIKLAHREKRFARLRKTKKKQVKVYKSFLIPDPGLQRFEGLSFFEKWNRGDV